MSSYHKAIYFKLFAAGPVNTHFYQQQKNLHQKEIPGEIFSTTTKTDPGSLKIIVTR